MSVAVIHAVMKERKKERKKERMKERKKKGKNKSYKLGNTRRRWKMTFAIKFAFVGIFRLA